MVLDFAQHYIKLNKIIAYPGQVWFNDENRPYILVHCWKFVILNKLLGKFESCISIHCTVIDVFALVLASSWMAHVIRYTFDCFP